MGETNEELRKQLHLLEKEYYDLKTKLQLLEKDLDRVEENYISKSDFGIVQKIVYGISGMILLSFVGAMTGFFWKKMGGP